MNTLIQVAKDYIAVLASSLFYLGCFTLLASQVVQAGSSYCPAAYHLYLVDIGRKQREDAFYTYPTGDLSDSEGLTIGVHVLALNDGTLELLNSFFAAFFDFYVHVDVVTRLKGRKTLSSFIVGSFYKLDARVHHVGA